MYANADIHAHPFTPGTWPGLVEALTHNDIPSSTYGKHNYKLYQKLEYGEAVEQWFANIKIGMASYWKVAKPCSRSAKLESPRWNPKNIYFAQNSLVIW